MKRHLTLTFFGDRNSKSIWIGRNLKKIFGRFIYIDMWDGYKSKIYFEKRITR